MKNFLFLLLCSVLASSAGAANGQSTSPLIELKTWDAIGFENLSRVLTPNSIQIVKRLAVDAKGIRSGMVQIDVPNNDLARALALLKKTSLQTYLDKYSITKSILNLSTYETLDMNAEFTKAAGVTPNFQAAIISIHDYASVHHASVQQFYVRGRDYKSAAFLNGYDVLVSLIDASGTYLVAAQFPQGSALSTNIQWIPTK